MSDSEPCAPVGPCSVFRAGHATHPIQAAHAGASPWGWRDAVVTGVDGLTVTADYVWEAGTVVLWHHEPLRGVLAPGSLLRVHERCHLVGTPGGWLNVRVTGGCGPVPVPDDPGLWRAETSAGIVDLATGRAVAVDHTGTDHVTGHGQG